MAAQNTAHTSGKCAVTKFNHEKSQQQRSSGPCHAREKSRKRGSTETIITQPPRHDFATRLEVILPG
jgi:hypothetical protein